MKQLIIAASIIIQFSKVQTRYEYPDGFGFSKTYLCTDTGTIKIAGKYQLTDTTLVQRKGAVTRTYWLINK